MSVRDVYSKNPSVLRRSRTMQKPGEGGQGRNVLFDNSVAPVIDAEAGILMFLKT